MEPKSDIIHSIFFCALFFLFFVFLQLSFHSYVFLWETLVLLQRATIKNTPKVTCNQLHNILRHFDALTNFPLTTS